MKLSMQRAFQSVILRRLGSKPSLFNADKDGRREVFTWGRGEDGQLGLGDADERIVPTKVATLSKKNARKVLDERRILEIMSTTLCVPVPPPFFLCA